MPNVLSHNSLLEVVFLPHIFFSRVSFLQSLSPHRHHMITLPKQVEPLAALHPMLTTTLKNKLLSMFKDTYDLWRQIFRSRQPSIFSTWSSPSWTPVSPRNFVLNIFAMICIHLYSLFCEVCCGILRTSGLNFVHVSIWFKFLTFVGLFKKYANASCSVRHFSLCSTFLTHTHKLHIHSFTPQFRCCTIFPLSWSIIFS